MPGILGAIKATSRARGPPEARGPQIPDRSPPHRACPKTLSLLVATLIEAGKLCGTASTILLYDSGDSIQSSFLSVSGGDPHDRPSLFSDSDATRELPLFPNGRLSRSARAPAPRDGTLYRNIDPSPSIAMSGRSRASSALAKRRPTRRVAHATSSAVLGVRENHHGSCALPKRSTASPTIRSRPCNAC